MRADKPMRSQSLITPATFMVRALVLPMSRKTLRFSPKAMEPLESSTNHKLESCDITTILSRA